MTTTDRIQKGEELVIINTNLFNKGYKKALHETVVVTDTSFIEEGVVECRYNGANYAEELQEKLVLPLTILKRKNQLDDDEYDSYLEVNKPRLFKSKTSEIGLCIVQEYQKFGNITSARIMELTGTIAGLYEFDKKEFTSSVLDEVINITKNIRKEGK
ncbi:hypothetical protein BPS10C_090 [Bacillus phage BPS10C]|uniref:Uncharacterized protein n=1 Tax=Bacillus phage BPS10C TaxID=1277886 RepID=W5QUU4_9CAUD|nr:hypothetical protein BPS10C_090 [Bacillus phage BPS10C]AGI12087.1 hypothetical protein BPS10C_090 [Bacillus phage BPS10C]